MPPRNNYERENVRVDNQNGPGLWFFARHAILRHYRLPEDCGKYQRKVVVWLRENNNDKLADPSTCITELQFKPNSEVTIPSRAETIEIIGGFVLPGMTYRGEIIVEPSISSVRLFDMNNTEIEDNKWIIWQPLRISVLVNDTSEQTNVKIIVFEKKNDEGYAEREVIETARGEEPDTFTAEWLYQYNGEELTSKPKIFFEARIDGSSEVDDSPPLEISMEINVVVVDSDNVLVIDGGDNSNDPNKKTNNPIEIKFVRANGDIHSEIKGKPDSKGVFKREGLIPSWFTLSVRTPMDRLHTHEIYPVGTNNSEEIHSLQQIDGSEIIKYSSTGDFAFAIDKTNVIKLPIAFLNNSDRATIDRIIGNRYFDKTINLHGIQISISDPTKIQVMEVLEHFSLISILHQQGLTDSDIEDKIERNTGGRGIALPNGIIYLPRNSRTPNSDALLVHEAYHQFQYIHHGKKNAFQRLVNELYLDVVHGITPYDFQHFIGLPPDPRRPRDPSLVENLQKITTLEGQAQYIDDFALTYRMGGILSPFRRALYDNKDASQIHTNIPF